MRWIVTHIAYTVLEVLLKMHILFLLSHANAR